MIWAGIVNGSIIGPFRVPEGVKVTAQAYCDLLEQSFIPWLAQQKATYRRQLVFMHDNAPSHAARLTVEYLSGKGFKNSNLMEWPPNSPDLNPIEHLWSIAKQRLYAGGRQFGSKDELWANIQLEMQQG
jgi:transposase